MKSSLKNVVLVILALCVPVLLALHGFQSNRYKNLENELKDLEKKQTELIEQNRQLISEISVLSSSERIERIAVEELGMRKVDSSEIIRVEVKGGKNE